MNSVWDMCAERLRFGQLRENKKTDVLVIGGGMAGILCAYMLRRAGVDCILVEAGRICDGITKNTTAKITYQHGLIYGKIIKTLGYERARVYLEAQTRAFDEYYRLCKEIDCDYERKDSYVYSVNCRKRIEEEVKALNRLGVDAEFSDKQALPFRFSGAVRVPNQAQFHPLKFAYKIASELRIYENTKVLEIGPRGAKTENGFISSEKTIVATHFPILNKHGSYFLKMYQHRSYVLALEGAPSVCGMYVSDSDKGMSFRNYGNILLVGGGGHRTGKSGGGFAELENFVRENYEGARTVTKWATQDCMTLDRISYIGRYSENTPDLYVATGFNKWGMTSSMAAAMILSDIVRGKRNDFASVFSPSRSIIHPQLAVNILESLVGILTPRTPRCSHLGCALKYNREEHSWDCPCHGSRFTEGGELIDNPATDDKRNMP